MLVFTAKPKVPGSCGSEDTAIRRTASLDTIYLKGHWPRDSFYWYAGSLQVDKATQVKLLLFSVSNASVCIG